ncbi:hypothetical protein P7C70_g3897, partial [Phenoliferia sp. Uapishka_3]
MSVALVQGGGGSLGSNFARHLLARTSLNVVATSRDVGASKSSILSGMDKHADRLTVLEVDARDEATIEKAASTVKERFGSGSLRLLLNVSGVLHADKSITQVSMKELQHNFEINTFAHLLTYKHFMGLLPKNADIRKAKERGHKDLANGVVREDLSVLVSLTARVGSIGDNTKGGWIGYRSSKAATNQIIMTLQRELELRATPSIAVALHPGTVVGTNLSAKWTNESDAGKKNGVFNAEDSTQRLLDVISGLGEKDGGRFLDWAGKEIPW